MYIADNDARGMRSIDVKSCTLTSKKYVVNKRLFRVLSLMSTRLLESLYFCDRKWIIKI